MNDKYFIIEIDGNPINEKYFSYEKALESAHLYFANNSELKEARIFRIDKEEIGRTYNKKWK